MNTAVARRRKGYEHEIEIREHRLISDEPVDEGGTDSGPAPAELLAASLATCTAITLEMYAERKGWELGQVEASVDFTKGTTDDPPIFDVDIKIERDLDEDQRKRLLVIAGKCPVHKALLATDVEINDSLQLLRG